jgi:hypothetical protein
MENDQKLRLVFQPLTKRDLTLEAARLVEGDRLAED